MTAGIDSSLCSLIAWRTVPCEYSVQPQTGLSWVSAGW